jgi:hypothetical protein
MKKFSLIALSVATLALAGCDNNKGGSSDLYTPSSGIGSSTNAAPMASPNSPQGAAVSPEAVNSGAGSSSNKPSADPYKTPDK